MINSKIIKTALLCYFKFGRASFSVTEFQYNYGIADVLALNKKTKEITEVEVKISKQDLLNEIKQKEHKHKILKTYKGNNYQYQYCDLTPNKFYYCVPEELVKEAEKVIEIINPKYGIMVFKKHNRPQDSIDVIKRAYKLHKNGYNDLALKEILNRMNNENCVLYRKMYWNDA